MSSPMSALLPLINELLPMFMPAEVHVRKACEIREAIRAKDQSAGGRDAARVVRHTALVNCGSMNASVLIVKPRCSTHVYHNGEHDAVIIATSGTGVLLTLPDMEQEKPTRNVLTPGSFAFVPAWTEHRIVNETDEAELRWTIVQNGNEPLSVDLESWAGDPIKTRKNGAVNGERIGETEKKKKKWEEGRMGYREAVTATVDGATEPQDLGDE